MKEYELTRALVLQVIKTRMAFRQTLQRELKRHRIDMTFEMLQIMNCLWHEQGLSQQTLAEKTAKDKACLTNLMTNLEKKGWIVRREDSTDRRNRLVYLTTEGETMNGRVRPIIQNVYTKASQQIDLKEIETCIHQLERLNEIFNQL